MSKKLLWSVAGTAAIIAATTLSGTEAAPPFVGLIPDVIDAVLTPIQGVKDAIDALTGLLPLAHSTFYCGNPSVVGTIDFNQDITALVTNGSLRPCFLQVDAGIHPEELSFQNILRDPNGLGVGLVVDGGYGIQCLWDCPNDPAISEPISVGLERRTVCATKLDDGRYVSNCGRPIGRALDLVNRLADLFKPLDFSQEFCADLFPFANCEPPQVICSRTKDIPSVGELMSVYLQYSIDGGLDWGLSIGPETNCNGMARCRDPNAFFCSAAEPYVQVSNGQVCVREVKTREQRENELLEPLTIGYSVVHPDACGPNSLTALPLDIGCPGLAATGIGNLICGLGPFPPVIPDPANPALPLPPCGGGGVGGGGGCVTNSCQKVALTDIVADDDINITINNRVVQQRNELDELRDMMAQLKAGFAAKFEVIPALFKAPFELLTSDFEQLLNDVAQAEAEANNTN